MKRSSLLLLAALVSLPAFAQEPRRPDPSANIRAMEKLSFLVGDWEGEGWIEMGGQRASFRGGEVVQRKLNGVALLVEGSFFARPEGSDREIPVHTTLGVISYVPERSGYRFHSWLAQGTAGERDLTVTDDGFQWDAKNPRGTVRYTMTLSGKGEWIEFGERSTDGTNWSKFFEMTLRKKP